ncbi:MAG TPA: thioredoxin domain-containing protein [Pseudonocardiaceae bacterium]
MANRLAASTSPYLRQHADNPVDWWEWGEDAFAEARRRNVPVLLSVGYAACHWCHVMAHESFEDEVTTAVMNEHFVNVKVDREERPDVDAVYMAATQAMTGHGGWPMTCFLTPDGEPFHCGTYYPPRPQRGMPSFRELLAAVSSAWVDRGGEVRAAAGRIAAGLREHGWRLTPVAVDAAALDAAVGQLATQFDPRHGGFGDAPKFPPAMVCEFLLRHYERTGSPQALSMAGTTAVKMARGGIYDQLAGGFARYSVDARWVVPHFEKMLYDNALLLRFYAHLARLDPASGTASGTASGMASGLASGLARRVADGTAEFLLGELRTPHGGFASSLDADAAGVEGLTYAWTPSALVEVLGDEEGAWAAELFAVTPGGTFEHGASVLQLPSDPSSSDHERFHAVRERLLGARARRPQPGRDDKVITAWNGLAITALAEAGAAMGRGRWVDAAVDAAELLQGVHQVDGRLRRSSRDGVAGTAAGVLEDYGCLAGGLLALHQATGSARWLDAACGLLDTALAHFADREADGRFYDTADDAEHLVSRPQDPGDNATPSGAAALTEALLTASALTDAEHHGRYRAAAEAALAATGSLSPQVPRFAGHWLTVAEAAEHGPIQVAVAGPADDPRTSALLAEARATAPGGTVILGAEPDASGVPLLAGRPLVGGAPAAYVCRGFVCDVPVTTPEALRHGLRSR